MTDVAFLEKNILGEFKSQLTTIGKRLGGKDLGIKLITKKDDKTLWITLRKGESAFTVNIPIPFTENGVRMIEQNEVKRAVCNYYIKAYEKIYSFEDVMHSIICGNPAGIIPDKFIKKSSFVKQMIYGFVNGYAHAVMHNMQRAINEVANKMPLHETNMNSWAMNQRLIMIDKEFDDLRSPADKLVYQIEKSKKYFERGWTSMGLSDGVLADKNYILQQDLRKLTPFGIKHHNPQRNLYSTLGMKGDEEPLVMTRSAKELADNGISRKGWNLFTVFADIPDVWEDQIMVDKSHAGKYAEYEKRYQCFGQVLVEEGEVLRKGHKLSIEPDGEPLHISLVADKIQVKSITRSWVNVGSLPTPMHNVIVSYRRNIKEGVKITNTAANKGVIRFADLGYAIDERTGEHRKIDVIVSGESVQKRKNFSQILEALLNNTNGEKPIVIPDDAKVPDDKLRRVLKREGFNEDGTWECHTYAGDFKAVSGSVFWGITHDAEDTVWDPGATLRQNNRDIRPSGLKFSTVEFRALETRFGKENAIIDEILGYAQGSGDLHEELRILQGKAGTLPKDVPVVNIDTINPVDQSIGTMVPKVRLRGTIVDEDLHPHGFLLQLPIKYQVALNKDHEVVSEGPPQARTDAELAELERLVTYDKFYVPSINLRRSWRHSTGKYGLNDIGTLLNNIVDIYYRYKANEEDTVTLSLLYRSIYTYFKAIADKMGSKRGELAVLGMAVRYPFAVKAVATLSNNLPKNTVEIHEKLAKVLDVHNGDVVLCERFPCLGFMSVRPQKVRITRDPKCRWTIRTSGNSLKSQNLDYDGDVIYLASFHTPEAKKALIKEWTNPNKSCYRAIQFLNKKTGAPHHKEMSLDEIQVIEFPTLTAEKHAEYVGRATGVKSHTGPVIALAYNVMRLVENSKLNDSQKINVGVEMFLDKVGNSVFSQKHGTKSLHDIVIEAICKADVSALVAEDFDRGISTLICDLIIEKMKQIGLKASPEWYYENITLVYGTNIISKLVREQNKIYFASRAQLEGCQLLHHLSAQAVDTPSKMVKRILSGRGEAVRTYLDKLLHQKELDKFNTSNMKDVYEEMCTCLEGILSKPKKENENAYDFARRITKTGRRGYASSTILQRRGIVHG